MADNLETQAGSGGPIVATDEIAGVHHPRTKVGFGADGSYADVSAANPLPVQGDVRIGASQQTESGAVLVGNTKGKLRDEFPTSGLNPAIWETISTGNGMAISTGNGTTGSYLRISSGTTINSETIIRSVEIFTLPVRLAAFVTASQRIANTEFFVELVEVNPATGLPITVALSQANSGTNRNYAAVRFAGTSATAVDVVARSGGAPEFVSTGAAITTTAATGSGPNWFPAGFIEIQASGEHVALIQNAIDATTQAAMARRITQAAPDPNATYKLQFRLRNLGTAPASSTDYRVHAVRLFDYTRHTVEVIGGPGHNGPGQAVPVNIAGGTTAISGTPTVVGAAAEDAAASGNPVMVAGVTRTANAPTTFAAGDVVRHSMTSGGALVVKQYAPQQVEFAANLALTTTTAAQIAVAGAAGIRNHLTSFWAINTGAAIVDLIILDGATERARYPLPVNTPVPVTFPTGLLTTAATALNANLSAAGTVRAVFTGYTSA